MKHLVPLLLISGAVLAQGKPKPDPTPGPVTTVQAPSTSPAEQRLSSAQQAFGLAHNAYRQGAGTAEATATWSLRIYESQKDAPGAVQQHLDRMVALEKLAKERVQSGTAPQLDVMTASYFRAQAEQLAGKK